MSTNIDLSWSLSIFIIFFFFFVTYIWDRFFSLRGLPKNLPWVGASSSAVSRAEAVRRSWFGLRDLIQNGYYEHSKHEHVFVLPNLATGPEVILPPSQLKWLLEQPDHVLNQRKVNNEFLHAERTMLHPNIPRDTVHGHVIRRELTKHIDNFVEAMAEESLYALSINWGVNTRDWTEMSGYKMMLDIVSRTSNRVLVGFPLCRNEDYLRCSSTFSRNVVLSASALNLLPSFLQSLFAPIITAYDTYQYRKIARHTTPIIKNRMAAFKPGLDYRNPDYSKHNDYIQWALHDAFSHDDLEERTAGMITKRLSVLSFALIQSSVITITNAIFDIACSPSSAEIQKSLREEIQRVMADNLGKEWEKGSLAKMVRLDSTLRESMRLWGFISRGVMKKVVAPEGITLPSGDFLPKGTNVGVTSYAVQHDESVYHRAFSFDPFRFSRPLEDPSVKNARPLPMVTTTDDFMAFSHGRHACPGRFFASTQLKILLAQIILNYDIAPLAKRPENLWFNNTMAPPMWDSLQVRRRPGTVTESVLPPPIRTRTASTAASFIPEEARRMLDVKVLQGCAASTGLAGPIVMNS
ncbi:cytochrome P450 [Venturia nashicola]|nr:cytochrome P450 [Venturia nashicola]